MRIIGQRVLAFAWVGLFCLAGAGQSRAAGSGKDGQGTMTVSPTSANARSTNNYLFSFRVPKNPFNSGSQATVQIPAGWAAPQTNNSSGPGFVSVTPVLSQSIASLNGISGGGPWTLSISFSTSQKQGGFNIDYQGAVAPTNAGIYSFLAQSRQSGGTLRALRSGSPTVTVNSPTKTNTTTTLI